MSEPKHLARRETPEERELGRKKEELDALKGVLEDEELILATQRAGVFLFERSYMRQVGSLYAELDDLEAKLADVLAQRDPKDETAQHRAYSARKQADATSQAKLDPDDLPEQPETIRFEPTDDLKQLYRQGAKRIHPDLAPPGASEEERDRRTVAMAAFSGAYAQGNETAMRAILTDWEERPERVEGADIGAQLIRIIRQVAQVGGRIEAVRGELEELQRSAMFRLWEKAGEAERAGHNLLVELAAELTVKLTGLRESLAILQRTDPKGG